MSTLTHDSTPCPEWTGGSPGWSALQEGQVIYLVDTDDSTYAVWPRGETPSCPWCGERISVTEDDGTMTDLWSWFEPRFQPKEIA